MIISGSTIALTEGGDAMRRFREWNKIKLTHDDVSKLRVNFCVQLGVPDEVDDPLLGVLRVHVEFLGQHLDGDALVNPTEGLEDHQPCVVNELVNARNQEEIVGKDGLAFLKFLKKSRKQ